MASDTPLGGTQGLGLAIAERIVTAHDGTLSLHTDGGLVVTVELPKEPLL